MPRGIDMRAFLSRRLNVSGLQLECACLYADGLRCVDISQALKIKQRTVNGWLIGFRNTLGVEHHAQAVAKLHREVFEQHTPTLPKGA